MSQTVTHPHPILTCMSDTSLNVGLCDIQCVHNDQASQYFAYIFSSFSICIQLRTTLTVINAIHFVCSQVNNALYLYVHNS